jgi:AcrR family transcriptional regulator
VSVTSSDVAAKRGRPRDPNTDETILEATARCLARDGYSRMTVGAVASEAGVTRPTIYRRWPTKAELTVAAISELVLRDTLPRTGDARADLLEIVRAVYRALIDQKRMRLFGSIFAEDHHNPNFVELFRKHVIKPRHQQFEDALNAGIASGQIRDGVDIAIVTDFLVGSFLSRWISGGVVPADWPERTVTLLWPSISTDGTP